MERIGWATWLGSLAALGIATPSLADLNEVVVSATRSAEAVVDLPVSVDVLHGEQIRTGQLQVNLSETLDQIPGVVAQSRQNYAQDLQISLRGFGARSSFGVRGVRLYADGIPGTMPDGQGQFSHFDLGSAERIEVLRGPFSALYGNSSGGVIAVFSEDGRPGLGIEASAMAGSVGTQRYALKGGGLTHGVDYILDASHFQSEGYRQHSAAERNLFNAKLGFALPDGAKLTLVANAVETPFMQDPLGVNRAQLASDPAQAGINALAYDTRKSLGQEQAGLHYTRTLGEAGELSAMGYAGERRTTQFQAILASAEARPTHPGGVIDLGRDYWGLDLHASGRYQALGPLQVTAGASYDRLDEARRGYLNFIGGTLGVEGALRREESNRVYDFDQYLEAQWEPAAHWRAIAGVRHSVVEVSSTDRLAVAGAPATSAVRYSATNPVAGLTYRPGARASLYASYGRGFETPTLNDLAYRSTDGSLPGLNLALKPARSENYELGVKAGGSRASGTLAAFYVSTRDELAVAANSGGRAVYQNIGDTRRRGLELSLDPSWSSQWSSRLAYTWLQALTVQAYSSCVGIPCLPVTIASGSRLPAVPANSFYAGLTWAQAARGLSVTLEALARAQIYVDDRNSDAAPAYRVFNAHATWRQQLPAWALSETLRVDNLTDRRYVGSVIVNESNARFFEPAPGREVFLGITAAYAP